MCMRRDPLLTGILVVMETRQMELLAAEPHTDQVVVVAVLEMVLEIRTKTLVVLAV